MIQFIKFIKFVIKVVFKLKESKKKRENQGKAVPRNFQAGYCVLKTIRMRLNSNNRLASNNEFVTGFKRISWGFTLLERSKFSEATATNLL